MALLKARYHYDLKTNPRKKVVDAFKAVEVYDNKFRSLLDLFDFFFAK